MVEERETLGAGSTAWILDAFGMTTPTGITVTPEGSLAYSAVLACVRVLAEGVASLPCLVYERYVEDGREAKRRAPGHPAYSLLHNAPNSVQTAFEFYEMGMAQTLLWGNFYAEIEWDRRGQVAGLWPLPAWQMVPEATRQGKLYHLWLDNQPPKTLVDYQVLHVPSFGYDGVQGKSMITLAREAVGLGMAAQRFGSAFFGNGARPGVVLEHPAKLSQEAHDRLKNSWNAAHQGLTNAQRVAILEEGMKMEPLSVPPEDAQFLQTRQFQRSEIAAIFRVPPHMIGDLERATFSNIEQQSTDFYTNTLQPWLRRWEQRLMRSLLVGVESKRYFVEFLVDALLRADTQSRYAAYAVGRQWGWLSRNDIRQRENMNPIEDGDDYLVPMNMMVSGGEDTEDTENTEEEPEEPRSLDHERRERETKDAKELRTATSRRRLAHSYQPTLEHVGQRIVNREVNDIRQAARKYLVNGDTAAFDTWMVGFDRQHSAFVREYLQAPLATYLRLVVMEIERELDQDIDERRLEPWGNDYITGRRNQWMGDLMRGLRQTIIKPDDAPDAWTAAGAVEDWTSERQGLEAERFAQDETVRGGNAMAIASYAVAGVIRKVWRSFGESCAYCKRMDGKIVEVNHLFLPAGESLVDEAGKAFNSIVDVGHPPLHGGCDCVVMAEL